MSEEILNEIVEETEVLEEETTTEEIIELPPQRVNPFCVISKDTVEVKDINGEKHYFHMIETNSAWGANPYGDAYAVVSDEMVPAIQETRGFCDIVLNEDGTEVVEFTAREIPEFPAPTPTPSVEERVTTLEETVSSMADAIAEGVNEV